jgi:hypothetical protein
MSFTREQQAFFDWLDEAPCTPNGVLVRHDDLVTTARTYTHVLADERELDYAILIGD